MARQRSDRGRGGYRFRIGPSGPGKSDWPEMRRKKPVRRRLLWMLILFLLMAMVALVAVHGGIGHGPGLTLQIHSVSSAMRDVGILVFIGGMLLTAFRGRVSDAFVAGLLWLVIVAFLLVGYTYRNDLWLIGNRVLAQLIPGYTLSHGRTVEVARGHTGDFSVSTRVNGASIGMILDTGASAVMLTQDAARAAGLPLQMLNYTVSLDTANGRTRAAPVTIDQLAVGSIIERAVPALIVPAGQLKSNLLGMTFLNRLESWQVKGNRLLLRGYR